MNNYSKTYTFSFSVWFVWRFSQKVCSRCSLKLSKEKTYGLTKEGKSAAIYKGERYKINYRLVCTNCGKVYRIQKGLIVTGRNRSKKR